MLVDRGFIGNAFYNMVQDMAEGYTLTTTYGEEYHGYISIAAATASSYMLGEREFLMKGEATFPDIESQSTFRGCYFRRDINPDSVYILTATKPKDTTPYVADIYAVKCNAQVSLGYLKEETTPRGDRILIPVITDENIYGYMDSTLQRQRQSSDGNFDQTSFFIQIPARYGITQDMVVIRKQFQFNPNTNKKEITDVRYRVQSVDTSLSRLDLDAEKIYGICDVQLSLDTRG